MIKLKCQMKPKIFTPLSNLKLAMLFVKGTCNEKSSRAVCQHILNGARMTKQKFWHLGIWISFNIWILTFGFDTLDINNKVCKMKSKSGSS